MILGFTGTQIGMSRLQKALFTGRLHHLCPDEFHHGLCTGADEEAHDLVRQHLRKCRIVGHPPKDEKKKSDRVCDEEWIAKEYLVRNKDIVFCIDELCAAPKNTFVEELRSGTWSTIRYARKAGKPIHMLMR